MRAPQDCSERLLLAVTGLSPQIVTETLWAIVKQTPAATPTAIQLVTTREGERRARLQLRGTVGTPGMLPALARELGIPEPPLSFTMLRDAAGNALNDLDSAADNIAAADTIAEAIRAVTANSDCAVHVSIAGGRKTMGYLAGMALSLFGREQDRLSHVLVNAPFQNHPAFFYPPAEPHVLIAEGKPVSTEDARIVLTEIPFLRLRHGFSAVELGRQGGYAAAIAAAQRRLGPARLCIDLVRQTIKMGGAAVELPPTLRAALLWFARVRLRGDGSASWREADRDRESWRRAVIDASDSCAIMSRSRAEEALKGGITADFLAEKRTRLNQRLTAQLGAAATSYIIETIGRRPVSRYRLATPPECITIIAATGYPEVQP